MNSGVNHLYMGIDDENGESNNGKLIIWGNLGETWEIPVEIHHPKEKRWPLWDRCPSRLNHHWRCREVLCFFPDRLLWLCHVFVDQENQQVCIAHNQQAHCLAIRTSFLVVDLILIWLSLPFLRGNRLGWREKKARNLLICFDFLKWSAKCPSKKKRHHFDQFKWSVAINHQTWMSVFPHHSYDPAIFPGQHQSVHCLSIPTWWRVTERLEHKKNGFILHVYIYIYTIYTCVYPIISYIRYYPWIISISNGWTNPY